jgi:hypothetical protein
METVAELKQQIEALENQVADMVQALDDNWVRHQEVVAARKESIKLRRIIDTADGRSAESYDWRVLGMIDEAETGRDELCEALRQLFDHQDASITFSVDDGWKAAYLKASLALKKYEPLAAPLPR